MLDVNEDFKGKKDSYDHMIEKVKFHKQNKLMIQVALETHFTV